MKLRFSYFPNYLTLYENKFILLRLFILLKRNVIFTGMKVHIDHGVDFLDYLIIEELFTNGTKYKNILPL